MANIAKVTCLGDTYQIVWNYQNHGVEKVHAFIPAYSGRTLHRLQILSNHGYSIDPPDMIDQLKSAIKDEEENDKFC